MGVKITKALREEASEYESLLERARRLGVVTDLVGEEETVAELRAKVEAREIPLAASAYLSVYEGEWGLKASSEDALAAILAAVCPERHPSTLEAFYAIRSNESLAALANYLWEELECEGLDETDIAKAILPKIREAVYS